MKFSTQALLLSAFATRVSAADAAAKNVTLTTESSDNAANGKHLSNIHFGAGINGALLSDSPVTYLYAPSNETVYQEVQLADMVAPYTFDVLDNTLIIGITGDSVKVKNNYLSVNGSDSVFYACSKLAYDPYNYAKDGTLGVGVYGSNEKAPQGCNAIKIKVEDTKGAASGAAPAGNSTALPTGRNSTATEIATKYTTIPCPSPTTVTYNSKTYTVSKATTLTVEDCQCTEAPKPTKGAVATSGPVVANGAAANKLGAAAIGAAAIGLLF